MSATIKKSAALLAISAAVVAVTAQGCTTGLPSIKYSAGSSSALPVYARSDYPSAAAPSSSSSSSAPSKPKAAKPAAASRADDSAAKKSAAKGSEAKTPAKKSVFFPLTPAERDMTERVVMASCGELDDYLMAKANAQVILDRVTSGRFGKNITAVLTAPHQFERPWRGSVNAMVKNAVSSVFDKGQRVTPEHIFYYINPHICSISLVVWEKDKTYVTTVGTGRYIHQYWTDRY